MFNLIYLTVLLTIYWLGTVDEVRNGIIRLGEDVFIPELGY